ncbi:hypothetical protein ACI2JA_03195 [Alkalihalobacillus sp. NPDC078783]
MNTQEIINQLRNGSISEYRVEKQDFLEFREELIKQDDFKNFRGNAQHGGTTIFTYEPGWSA